LHNNSSQAQLVTQLPRLTSPASNDWGPLDETIEDVEPQQGSRSLGGLSSVVRDGGYSLDQSDIADVRPAEQTFALSGLGAQFPDIEVVDTRPDRFLEELIRSKRVHCAQGVDLEFLPVDELERIMTWENIYHELSRTNLTIDVGQLTQSLCRRGKQSRQRIFAILCMVQFSAKIVDFEQAELYDRDLPFTFKHDGVYRETTDGPKRISEAIDLFQRSPWEHVHRDGFQKYQSQLAAPIFKFAWAPGEKVLHFALKDQLVLPFVQVEDTIEGDVFSETMQRQGGFSIVRKVKIHTAHYNASKETVCMVDEFHYRC
jgi:hypothetical protein